jgi:hypothetical protein
MVFPVDADRNLSTHVGAYGLRLSGLPELDRHLSEVPQAWAELRLCLGRPDPAEEPKPPGTIRIAESSAELWLAEAGRIQMHREPLSASFATRVRLSTDAILHPFLALPAVIANRWLGRIALHGGAFVHQHRAFALLGAREAGKSATLAGLLEHGCQILSDDVVVIEEDVVFAGPRAIDVREDVAAGTAAESLGVVGNRPRWRLRPPPGPASVPLGGMVTLAWGEQEEIVALDAGERLRALVSSCALAPDGSAAPALLPLIALPAWRYQRPRGLASIDRAAERLLSVLAR